MTTTFEETLPPKRWSWWPRVVLHASWPWQKDQKDNPEPAPSYIENKHNGHKFPHLHEQLLRAKFSEGFIALLPYPWSVKVSLSQSTFTLIMWKSLQKRVHGYMEIWITEIDEAWCRWSWHGSWYWFTIVLIFVNAHLTKRPTKRSGAAWRLTPQRPVRSWAREHPQDPCGPADGKAHCWHWYTFNFQLGSLQHWLWDTVPGPNLHCRLFVLPTSLQRNGDHDVFDGHM